jgi:hypothetical protein
LGSILVTVAPVIALVSWVAWTQGDAPLRGVQRALESVGNVDGPALAFAALFWLIAANDARKALLGTGWLAAFDAQDLFVKWRSYQNAHWGTDDIQVLQLPLAAIRSARVLSRWWTTPDGRHGGGRSEPACYVELTLAPDVFLTDLARHLADERAGRPCGRSIGWKGMWGDVPVSIEEGSVLRIRWRAWPTAARFVAALGTHGIATAAPHRDEVDLHAQATEPALRQLARTGDVIGLVRTLRSHDRNLSLAAARERATALIDESRS